MCDVTEGLVALETEKVPASKLQHCKHWFMSYNQSISILLVTPQTYSLSWTVLVDIPADVPWVDREKTKRDVRKWADWGFKVRQNERDTNMCHHTCEGFNLEIVIWRLQDLPDLVLVFTAW